MENLVDDLVIINRPIQESIEIHLARLKRVLEVTDSQLARASQIKV